MNSTCQRYLRIIVHLVNFKKIIVIKIWRAASKKYEELGLSNAAPSSDYCACALGHGEELEDALMRYGVKIRCFPELRGELPDSGVTQEMACGSISREEVLAGNRAHMGILVKA